MGWKLTYIRPTKLGRGELVTIDLKIEGPEKVVDARKAAANQWSADPHRDNPMRQKPKLVYSELLNLP